MKNRIPYIISVLIGISLGCLIGLKSDLSGWDFIVEVVFGSTVTFSLADAFLKNEDKCGVLVGTILGSIIGVSLDWLAGSPILLTNKLIYIMPCTFVGWGASWGRPYWRPVLLFGALGGIIGIILGFNRGCIFGLVYLPAGPLNAGLTFMQLSVACMGFGSLYLKSIGWKHLEKNVRYLFRVTEIALQ